MLTQISEFAANHPLLVLAFVALLALTFLNELKIATQRFASLTPAAAVQLMNKGDVVLEKHKDKTILVYCKVGSRSSVACKELTRNGFAKVFSLSGGIMAWQDAHLPVTKK